jgi:hypothetical protein
MILDACKSGRMHAEKGQKLGEAYKQAYDEGRDDRATINVVFLSASRDNQNSAISLNGSGSLFLQALLRGMQGLGHLSLTATEVTLPMAYNHAFNEVFNLSGFRQTPYLSGGLLRYPLVEFDAPCDNLFQVLAPKSLTHRTNRKLVFKIRLMDPTLLQSLGYQDLELHWHLVGEGPFRARALDAQRSETDIWTFEIDAKFLHAGPLSFRPVFLSAKPSDFVIDTRPCQRLIRIRQ